MPSGWNGKSWSESIAITLTFSETLPSTLILRDWSGVRERPLPIDTENVLVPVTLKAEGVVGSENISVSLTLAFGVWSC